MVTTEVVSTNWYWTGYGNGEVRKWQDGTYHKWQAERWQELSVDEVAQYVPIDQIWEDQAIEEEYDMLYWRKDKHNIRPVRKIWVSRRWSFTLFAVELGEERGYVGENAVEYFDFK